MKKLFLLISIVCLSAFAEASFNQIEDLIAKHQYAAAASGLEGIIANHPNSAKAYYAMSQAQAGLGNQEKATYALNKARGLDPDLKFASTGNVQNLQTAITPQVAKIEPIHETDYTLLKWILALGAIGGLFFWYRKSEEAKDKKIDEANSALKKEAEKDINSDYHSASPSDQAYMREYNMAPKAKPHPSQQATFTAEQQAKAAAAQNAYASQATYASPMPSYAQAPTQSVVHHHHDNSSALLNAVIINDMLNHSHNDTTRIIEREVVREVPAAPSRDSSWDTPSSSRSSSWDTPSSSSSSWGSSSSSSSDSSWGSSSSSDSSWD